MKKILVVMGILLPFYFLLCLSTTYASDQFESENVEMKDGGITGTVCNKTNSYFEEVYMKAVALNFRSEELWTLVITIAGIGPHQCKSFYKRYLYIKQPHKYSFTYFPRRSTGISDIYSTNNKVSFQDISVERNEVTGKICNKSRNTLEGEVLSLIGANGKKEVMWKLDIIISKLLPEDCYDFLRFVIPKFINEEPSNYLFSINKLNTSDNINVGKINDKISYKKIVVHHERLKGDICNDSDEQLHDLFIRFFAISSQNNLMWTHVVSAQNVKSHKCKSFVEYLVKDKVPTQWKFMASSWYE